MYKRQVYLPPRATSHTISASQQQQQLIPQTLPLNFKSIRAEYSQTAAVQQRISSRVIYTGGSAVFCVTPFQPATPQEPQVNHIPRGTTPACPISSRDKPVKQQPTSSIVHRIGRLEEGLLTLNCCTAGIQTCHHCE